MNHFEKWEKKNNREIKKQNKKNTVTPFDLLNSKNYTNEELANARYEICLGCPQLISFSKQCRKCGCFMSLKTKLTDSSCPIGKW
jgi:hypothetical protein